MIGKQQKFIEDNDIGATAQGESKYCNSIISKASFSYVRFFLQTLIDIKIFLGDDEEDDENEDDQIEETEANEVEAMGNGRSGSVTGKYNEMKGNLHGAGALASSAAG